MPAAFTCNRCSLGKYRNWWLLSEVNGTNCCVMAAMVIYLLHVEIHNCTRGTQGLQSVSRLLRILCDYPRATWSKNLPVEIRSPTRDMKVNQKRKGNDEDEHKNTIATGILLLMVLDIIYLTDSIVLEDW